MEHFVLLYSKLLFLFIISGAFCLLYFKLILLLFLVDHKNIKNKKREPKESINRSRRLEKEKGGAKLWRRGKKERGRRKSS